MMENTSVSVAKCNSERQHSLGGYIKRSCSKSVTEKESGGDRRETEVMVGRVSSTTEHGPLTVHEKQLDVVKSVLPDKIPNAKAMAEKHRNKEKHMHSRTPDQVSKSKLYKSSQSPFGREDERFNRQLQGISSVSRKDKALHPHTSTKKHNIREDKQVEPEVSSSSLASASLRTCLPATTQISPLSSTRTDRKFDSVNSKPVSKSYSERDKYVRPPSGNVNTLIKRGSSLAKNYSRDVGKHEYFRKTKEKSTGQGSHKEYGSSFHRDRKRESSSYEKMVEMKVREIRNNLEKMSSEIPRTLAGSVSKDTFSESKQDEEGPGKECEEQGSQPVAILPSSRCCSPPPRPTNVTKYWSDAEETEDESDVEIHLMHINSVNIVLNFLKKNTNKYYVDGKEVSTQSRGDKTMQVKRNSKFNIRGRLSYQPHTSSHYDRSKSVHRREHLKPGKQSRGMSVSPTKEYRAGSTMRECWSPSREHYGHSSRSRSPLLAEQSSWRDQWSRSPSSHREFYDRKNSLHTPGYKRRCDSRSRSPPGFKRRDSRSRSPPGFKRCHDSRSHSPPDYKRRRDSRSRSPPGYQESFLRKRDHRYRRSSSSHRSRESFPRDRSDSPLTYSAGPYRESSSPPRYREGFQRKKESPFHMWDAEDSLRNRGSLSPSPVFDKESVYRNKEFSRQRSQRSRQRSPGWNSDCDPRKQMLYSTDTSCHSKDLHFPSQSRQEEPKVNYKNSGTFRSSELHQRYADSRRQHISHGPSHKDRALSQGSETQLRGENSLPTSRSGHCFGPSSLHLSPLHSGRQVPSHVRDARGFESPRSGSSEGSVELHASVVREGSGLGRSRSGSNARSVTPRWQLIKRENENKLPLEFGKGAKKAWNLDGALRWKKKFLSVDNRKQQKKNINFSGNSDHFFSGIGEDTDEYQRCNRSETGKGQGHREEIYFEEGSTLDTSLKKDTNNSTPVVQENVAARQMDIITLGDDDEPTIDRPEDYLNASSSVSTYHQPSFVPDAQKLVSLAETSELLQTQEDLGVPGPSGITSAHSLGGKERDDSPCLLSDSKYDQEIEDVDSTVPQISSPGTSQKAALPKEATSGTPNMAELSSAIKDITTEEATKEEEKAFLTLNSAEMSTLLTLINLAKEHVATGKGLPTNLSQILETGRDSNTSKISKPQGDQSSKNQIHKPSVPQISAGMQVENENEQEIKATTSESNTSDNRNIGEGQNNKKDVASVTNKNNTIPEGKRDEIVLKRKTDDNLSKDNNKPSQSKSKTQGNKTDDKLPKGKKSSMQSSQKYVDETTQEKCKEKGQSLHDGGDVKETINKKKVNHKDKAKRQSKSNTKGTVVERTFAEMQSVRVDLSASRETVASSRRGKCYKIKRTTTLRNPKKEPLKKVGKRIFIRDSSDSDSDNSESQEDEKDAPSEADNHPQAMHPLHQETIVLNHSVNTCLACKHILKPDEFTSMSLNTGTVTMRCRNCHTYTRMEKVMSLDFYTTIPMPKNVPSQAACSASSKTSETSGTSVENNNSKISKKGNMVAPSKEEQDENTNKKGGSLDSNKQVRKEKKHSSQGSKNVVKEGMVETSASQKVFKGSKDDKCQRDRKESESRLFANKGADYEMREDEQKSVSEFDSIDPTLRVFPWTSSRKRKKLHEDLILNEDFSDSDECDKKQQHEKPNKKMRKSPSSTKRKQSADDETSTQPRKLTKVVKPSTTTKVSIANKSSDSVKTSNSTKSALNTNPGMKEKKVEIPKSSVNTKPTTTTKSTTYPKPTTAPKPTTSSKPPTTSKPTTISKSTTSSKPTTAPKPTTISKSTTSSKPTTTPKPTTISKSTTSPKATTAPKPTTTSKSTTSHKPTTTPNSTTTSKSTTFPKPTTASKSTTDSKPTTDTKSTTAFKHSTTFRPKTVPKSSTTFKSTTPESSSALKSSMEIKSCSVGRSSTGTESSSVPEPSTSVTSVISIRSDSGATKSTDSKPVSYMKASEDSDSTVTVASTSMTTNPTPPLN